MVDFKKAMTPSYAVHDDKRILGFFGPYRFLSNFYAAYVMFDGHIYKSTEAAYQAAKSLDVRVREQFTMLNAKDSKEQGQLLTLRPDWDEVKRDVMLQCVFSKFHDNEDLMERLRATGTKHLEERNSWHDTIWGTDLNGVGTNWLGITLMKVRDQI